MHEIDVTSCVLCRNGIGFHIDSSLVCGLWWRDAVRMRSGEHNLTEVNIPKGIIRVALSRENRCTVCAQVEMKLRLLEDRGTAKVHERGKTQ